MYSKICKRIIDGVLAAVICILSLPLTITVALLLFIVNHGAPFFTQFRPGKDGRLFKIIKFKTMNDKRDAEGRLLEDSERLTRIGRIVRKLSIDEIPQLLNVLMGHMSLVGPRPLLPEYLPLYSTEQARRHEVKPGITGWAQVNGRNAISWEEKFELDVWYVDNISFKLDLMIILRTIKKVVISEGINSQDSVPMVPFWGNEKMKQN